MVEPSDKLHQISHLSRAVKNLCQHCACLRNGLGAKFDARHCGSSLRPAGVVEGATAALDLRDGVLVSLDLGPPGSKELREGKDGLRGRLVRMFAQGPGEGSGYAQGWPTLYDGGFGAQSALWQYCGL